MGDWMDRMEFLEPWGRICTGPRVKSTHPILHSRPDVIHGVFEAHCLTTFYCCLLCFYYVLITFYYLFTKSTKIHKTNTLTYRFVRFPWGSRVPQGPFKEGSEKVGEGWRR